MYTMMFLPIDRLSIPEREQKRVQNDPAAVIRTPAMVGGLQAMDKEYFYKSGSYDEQMDVWGGEEVCIYVTNTCTDHIHSEPSTSRAGRIIDPNLDMWRFHSNAALLTCRSRIQRPASIHRSCVGRISVYSLPQSNAFH